MVVEEGSRIKRMLFFKKQKHLCCLQQKHLMMKANEEFSFLMLGSREVKSISNNKDVVLQKYVCCCNRFLSLTQFLIF